LYFYLVNVLTKVTDYSKISYSEFKKRVLDDYFTACLSRQMSILGRKEVLSGKAKFGIFGDGKEIAQIAMAHQFREGDWRSGYYRDQTFMLATGMTTPENFFAQLYGDTDIDHNPDNGGRSMVCHFATRYVNPDGSWKDLTTIKISAADLSPTSGQLPRLLGLAYASKLFRQNVQLHQYTHLSRKGNEVAFGTIGDSATSEGHFFEMMIAAGVLQVPLAIAVWDDGYGISVPVGMQTTKGSISELLKGFEADSNHTGIAIYKGKGWDYPGLCRLFEEGIKLCRDHHVPVLFHIQEMTQPLGHSTSGSHERYKPPERLKFEADFDPIRRMRQWILTTHIASQQELDRIETEAEVRARKARDTAWEAYQRPILEERESLLQIIERKSCVCRREHIDKISFIAGELRRIESPLFRDSYSSARRILRYICPDCPTRSELQQKLQKWISGMSEKMAVRYQSHLYNETRRSALFVEPVAPVYDEPLVYVPGREILRENFDALFATNPLLVTFGEDTGNLGDVNQCLEGLQAKYGPLRITDTGIREATIIGQGIGMAMRGLRPIAEIQYFDYILYCLQTLSDDLASLRWRTAGGQSAPLIVRTRGHRLEGIWHSGSPMSMIINSIRGIYVCVPRNLTQAAGFYNTLLEADDPALIVEPLNAYRLKEPRPTNPGKYRIPLGVPEIMREGRDATLVTYGACVRIAMDAAKQLSEKGIEVEVIDVQTLIPFDLPGKLLKSLQKTNRVVFLDEDVPGGATAYMADRLLYASGGFEWLDHEPVLITAREHRPAYSSDGDYFSNPNAEDVFDAIYRMMHNLYPQQFPQLS